MKKRLLSFILSLCICLGLTQGICFVSAADGTPDFSDVTKADWFYDDVLNACKEGLMIGISADTFAPGMTFDRAMAATILYRMSETPAVPARSFSDVPEDCWFTDAVSYASANKVAVGYGNGQFGATDCVTREQLVLMLYRYAQLKLYDVTDASPLSAFKDADKVSRWALDAVKWAVQNQILTGTDGHCLNPQGSATRAEAAAMLYRFVKAYVSPEDPNLTLTIDQDSETTVEIAQEVSGVFATSSDTPIENITYVAKNPDYVDPIMKQGEVLIDESTGTWSIDGLVLSPGENTVTVVAEDVERNTYTKDVTLTLDAGELEPYDDTQFSQIGDTADQYVNDTICVFIDRTVTQDACDAAVEAVCAAVGGTVIGQLNVVRLFQLRVARNSYEGLQALCDVAETVENVTHALCDYAAKQSEPIEEEPDPAAVTDAAADRSPAAFAAAVTGEATKQTITPGTPYYPNDPWNGATWDEANPGGANWWSEAIHCPTAWSYDSYCTEIVPIGIVDSGVDRTHADLYINAISSDYTVDDDHATHVAGIISGLPDNNEGMTGICWHKAINNYDAYRGSNSSSEIMTGYYRLIAGGLKVINCSNGYYFETIEAAEEFGYYDANMIDTMLDYHTFIIVQAAGNESHDSRLGGGLCSIPVNYDASRRQLIMDRIVVVGSVAMPVDGKYTLSWFSNYGESVDIVAPGSSIYSCYVSSGTGGNYGYMSGTSMATPVVTGTIAMLWSMKPDLTPAEMKELIKTTASTPVARYAIDDPGTYYMIDAGAAAKRVVQMLTGNGQADACVVDAATGNGISVSYRVHQSTETGTVMATGATGTNGNLSVELAAGSYVLELYGNGFITGFVPFAITLGAGTDIGDVPISTTIDANTYRVVLQWGKKPYDLDAHLIAGNGTHIYNGNMNATGVTMDTDDIMCYGPETITVSNLTALGGFTFSVHDFTDRTATSGSATQYALAGSGAVVKLYRGNTLAATYAVPTNRAGNTWKVFSVSASGTVTANNIFSFKSDSASVS